MKLYALSLFLHLTSVTVWVGGMFFAYLCLRPAASSLKPEQRLPLWEAALGRFLNWVGIAVVLILLSGLYMMMTMGPANTPWPIHAMAGLGIVMMLAFGHARFASYRRLRRAVRAQNWPDGARALDGVRRIVAFNLVLGFIVIALAAAIRG